MDVMEKNEALEQAVPGAATDQPIAPEPAKKTKRVKKTRKKLVRRIITLVIVLAVILAGVWFFSQRSRNVAIDPSMMYTYEAAALRDISSTLEGSGTLQPANSYTVATLVSGEILSADFEEGDIVSKGDVLYEIDSSDSSTSIERSETSVEASQRNYNKKLESLAELTIKAPITGVITGLSVSVGDTIGTQSGVVTIENISTLKLTEYYSEEYRNEIYVGMAATVSIGGQMLNLEGRVTELSSLTRVSETGITCFGVTISVTNPGSLVSGTSATAWLGEIYPSISDDDGLDANDKKVVYAGVSGKVAQVNVRNFEKVNAGDTIMILTSDTLADEIQNAADSLHDAKLSLQSQYDSLDNYTITAPIDGTIIEKYYKEGENSDGGKTLCTIYDLSSLSLTMSVDELDINSVAVGQRATITTDSAEGRIYDGVVTRVGVNGTTSGGVTTYPVTIRIDETDRLLPGMNVDVTIIVAESTGVLSIPSAAVARGNRVLVKTADGSTGEHSPAPGYEYVMVVTGLSDSNYIEIISGLSLGTEIAYIDDIMISEMPLDFGFGMDGMGDRPMAFESGGTSSVTVVEAAPGGARPIGPAGGSR